MPNRITLLTPSALAAAVSLTASSTDRLNTPGIEGTSRRTPRPSQTNNGSMNMSGDSRVSRTSARIAGVRRSRRSRRVIVRPVGA
jgi:hypothetical protein